jgi:hypothetical protein
MGDSKEAAENLLALGFFGKFGCRGSVKGLSGGSEFLEPSMTFL